MGKSAFNDEQARRISDATKVLVSRFGSQEKVADKLGITQGAVSALVRRLYAPTEPLARQIADLLGTDLDTMIGRKLPAGPKDKYANRGVVSETAERLGFSNAAINRLSSVRLLKRDDAPTTWWFALLVDFEQREIDGIKYVESEA
jgi:transcriptional regulator with XRE-family HTH domain